MEPDDLEDLDDTPTCWAVPLNEPPAAPAPAAELPATPVPGLPNPSAASLFRVDADTPPDEFQPRLRRFGESA